MLKIDAFIIPVLYHISISASLSRAGYIKLQMLSSLRVPLRTFSAIISL